MCVCIKYYAKIERLAKVNTKEQQSEEFEQSSSKKQFCMEATGRTWLCFLPSSSTRDHSARMVMWKIFVTLRRSLCSIELRTGELMLENKFCPDFQDRSVSIMQLRAAGEDFCRGRKEGWKGQLLEICNNNCSLESTRGESTVDNPADALPYAGKRGWKFCTFNQRSGELLCYLQRASKLSDCPFNRNRLLKNIFPLRKENYYNRMRGYK